MSSGYRLAPALAARLVGLALVGSAAAVLVATVLTVLFDGPAAVVVAVGAVALVGSAVLAIATRRRLLLSLDDVGYRVRWVRGTGVRSAGWREVSEAVAASPGGIDCVVLRLRDGRTTSLPVDAVAVGREQLTTELRARLARGEGLRPL